MSDRSLTQAELKRILHYDPDTGVFTWKVDTGRYAAGAVAGIRNANRPGGNVYVRIWISSKKANYSGHRLAWFYVHGQWPDEIDHINHDGMDNRIANLRASTRGQNALNMKRHRHNTSGTSGVWLSHGKWAAAVEYGGWRFHLGVFQNKSDAIAARKAAEKKYGFHPNHGKAG